MTPLRERLVMGLVFAGLPLLLYGLVLRPSMARTAALHGRIAAANGEVPKVQSFVPVGQDERAFLDDPAAAWRTRLPRVDDDAARLLQVNRVVSSVNAALKAKGLGVAAMRATWEPVSGDFTLPPVLAWVHPPRPAQDTPECQMAAWVLEVEIPGPTDDLFKALAAVADMNPLLEPVGMRWSDDGEAHHQYLLLRSYYLRP